MGQNRSDRLLKIGSLVLPIVLLIWSLGCERRDPSANRDLSPVLVVINDQAFTERQLDLFLPQAYQEALTLDEKRDRIDRWITTQLLYEEAMREGLGRSADITARLEQYKKDLVADQLVQKVIREQAVVGEDEIRAYYNEHAEEYLKEVRVSHILVNTPEDAEKVKNLLGTRSFLYLSRKYSIDKHSGAGGDLGYLSKGNMIPEFENVVFGMRTGETSDIIETEFGYHILKLVDIRDARVKLTYEDVKSEIANILVLKKRQDVYDNLVNSLKRGARIEIMDEAIAFQENEFDSLQSQ